MLNLKMDFLIFIECLIIIFKNFNISECQTKDQQKMMTVWVKNYQFLFIKKMLEQDRHRVSCNQSWRTPLQKCAHSALFRGRDH